MADKMIYPIGFDLKAGVDEAIKEWSTQSKRLEDAIQKRPIKVKLAIDLNDIGDLSAKITRGVDPKITPKLDSASFESALQNLQNAIRSVDYDSLTEKEAEAIKTLTSAVNSLARAYGEKNKAAALEDSVTKELKAATAAEKRAKAELNTAKAIEQRNNKEANIAIARAKQTKAEENAAAATKRREKTEQELAAAQNRRIITENNLAASTARMEKAQLSLANAQEKANNTAINSHTKLKSAYSEQSSYLSNLIKKMVAYASVQQIGNFLTKVREVTAEFELQRVSLGAIINDQNRANEIFSEIKQFALKSPIKIMDLTKYTKQLAAYRVETDNLFETTKRLADVAVGLGGNGIMERLILAYGETKATNVMNAKELRQFAFMGIPMLELLSEKLSELKGKTISTAETFEMIKKRMVHFDIVKQVFEDLTSAGGTFYNMQEKQGNTLYGMWAKLGDAASVMYDEIGNTDEVNSAMRGTINLLTELMRNWKAVGWTLVAASVAGASAAFAKFAFSATRVAAAQAAVTAATKARQVAVLQLGKAIEKGAVDDINAANATLQKAKADEIAAQAAAKKGGMIKSAALSLVKGLGISIAIAAVTTLIYKIAEAYENAHRLQNQIKEIRSEGDVLAMQSAREFEVLADRAVFAKSIKEQNDALDELRRTYKDSLPVEAMSIENLSKLRNGANDAATAYAGLTQSIKEYVYQQQRQKEQNAILEETGKDMRDALKGLDDFFKKNNISPTQKGWFFKALEEEADDASKTINQKVLNALRKAGINGAEMMVGQLIAQKSKLDVLLKRSGYIENYLDALTLQREKLKELEEYYDGLTGYVGEYSKAVAEAKKRMDNFVPTDANGKEIKQTEDYYAYQKAVSKEQIKQWGGLIVAALREQGVQIKNEWFNLAPNESFDLAKITSININAIRQELGRGHDGIVKLLDALQVDYNKLVPSNRLISLMTTRIEKLTAQFGLNMNQTRQYLMDTEEDITKYAKRIKESLEEAQTKLKQLALERQMLNKGEGKGVLANNTIDKIKEETELTQKEIDFLKALSLLLSGFTSSKGGKKSDPRLQNLKEEISLVQKLYQEYKQLEKQEGAGKAAADMERMAGKSIKALADKYGIQLPKTAKNLTDALEILYKKMEALPKKAFPALDKELRELRWTIEKVNIDESQKNIEKSLKELSDRISQSKAAKEFYDKILSQTGDMKLAADVTLSIYGSTGGELKEQIASEITELFQTGEKPIEIGLDIIDENFNINYKRLKEFAKEMFDAGRIGQDAYEKINKAADDGQKQTAKTFEGYLKDIKKTQDYADKVVELARKTAQTLRDIDQNRNLDADQKETLKKGYLEKQSKEAAKLEYEAFKETPLYVQMFENLENASTFTLENMKKHLVGLQGMWGTALDPKQLKELQSKLNEIDEQLGQRNPFKRLKESYQAYQKTLKSYTVTGRGELVGNAMSDYYNTAEQYGADSAQAKLAERELNTQRELLKISKQLTDEKGKQLKGQKALDKAAQIAESNLTRQRGALDIAIAEEQDAIAKSKEKDPNKDPEVIAKHMVVEAEREQLNIAQKVAEITTDDAKKAKTWKDSMAAATDVIFKGLNAAGEIARGVADIMETVGADEEDVKAWNDAADALGDITEGLQDIINNILSLNVMGIITSVITAVPKMFKGFWNLSYIGRVRRANKLIREQTELVDQLEKAYSRLEKSIDKSFGVEYVDNYNKQIKNLEAQAEAARKKYEAELSKGKKADEEKAKEYQEEYEDALEKIKDKQTEVAEHMMGTDVASAARDFAKAWLEAYGSYANTADAIKDKFKDMIQSMIVESTMGAIVQAVLQPIFDEVQKRYTETKDVTGTIIYALTAANEATERINDGLMVATKHLEASGVNVRKLFGGTSDLKGISRDIASASEESINGLAAGINTQNWYISHVPTISENVAAIRLLMENGYSPAVSTTEYVDWKDWQGESLDRLSAIERHTAETAAECRRSASAAEDTLKEVRKLVDNGGGTPRLRVRM